MDRIYSVIRTLMNSLLKPHLRLQIFLIILGLSSAACGFVSGPTPLRGITELNIIGVWEGEYSLYNGVDILTIKNDNTYEQMYKDDSGYVYSSSTNKWQLENIGAGRLFVRLEKGRYFPEGVDFANLLGVDPLHPDRLFYFYDPTDSGSRQMNNELLLEVFVSNNKNGVKLCHFLVDIDANPECFSLNESQ